LFDNGTGGFVNRFGANGEPYVSTLAGTETGGSSASEAACANLCAGEAENETQCANGNACRMLNDAATRAENDLTAAERDEDTTEDELVELEAAVEAAA
jgi:hypothetical protein